MDGRLEYNALLPGSEIPVSTAPPTPLRIACITSLVERNWLASFWLELVAGLRGAGHQVTAFAPVDLACDHLTWPVASPRWNPLAHWSLGRRLRAARPQVTLALGEKAVWFAHRCHPAPLTAILAGQRSDYASYAACRRVIALTPDLAAASGLPAGRCQVQYPPGAGIQAPPGTRERFRQSVGADLDIRVLLVSGSVTAERRLEELLLACSSFDDLEVWIEGEGPHVESLTSHTQGLGQYIYGGRDMGGRRGGVRFLGRVAKPDEALAAADLVFVSRPKDGFARQLPRALLSRKPVVCEDFPQAAALVPTAQRVEAMESQRLQAALEPLLDPSADASAGFAGPFDHAARTCTMAAFLGVCEATLRSTLTP